MLDQAIDLCLGLGPEADHASPAAFGPARAPPFLMRAMLARSRSSTGSSGTVRSARLQAGRRSGRVRPVARPRSASAAPNQPDGGGAVCRPWKENRHPLAWGQCKRLSRRAAAPGRPGPWAGGRCSSDGSRGVVASTVWQGFAGRVLKGSVYADCSRWRRCTLIVTD
jgi:hypothetical protein